MTYADDDALVLIRPDILGLGVSDWGEQHIEAAAIINRALDAGWYRRNAQERNFDVLVYPFDSANLLSAKVQLTRLGCYKALEIIYGCLSKGTGDSFESLRNYYGKSYTEELKAVLAAGLDYDWYLDGSLTIDDQNQVRLPRRLVRG